METHIEPLWLKTNDDELAAMPINDVGYIEIGVHNIPNGRTQHISIDKDQAAKLIEFLQKQLEA